MGEARRATVLPLLPLLLLVAFPGQSCRAGARPGSKTVPLIPPARLLYGSFGIGVGDRYDQKVRGKWLTVWKGARRMGLRPRFQALWFTRGWNATWVRQAQIREMARAGVVPVAISYYWGDHISVEKVRAERKAWLAHVEKVAKHMAVAGTFLLVLEPEFNNKPAAGLTPITRWADWNDLLLAAMGTARRQAPGVLVGPCPGDFALHNLGLSMGRAAKAADFIAFQEMRASTRAFGYPEPYQRVDLAATRFAGYLSRTFRKPLLLAYLAVSSHGRTKKGRSWVQVQASILDRFGRSLPGLKRMGLFGALLFQLYDDPQHTGYFGRAERGFGLVTAMGRAKPALQVVKRWRQGAGRTTTSRDPNRRP